MPDSRVTLVVPARYRAFDVVRSALGAFLADGADEETRTRLAIGLGEAFNNVVTHAYGGQGSDPVEIRFERAGDRVVLEVRDEGRPMSEEDRARLAADAEVPDPASTAVEDLPERGFGFGILRSVADSLEYRSAGGRNVLRLEKEVRAEAAVPEAEAD
jgi:serine/threonine-protein kinase RsbW